MGATHKEGWRSASHRESLQGPELEQFGDLKRSFTPGSTTSSGQRVAATSLAVRVYEGSDKYEDSGKGQ